jgi:hypothetical protein
LRSAIVLQSGRGDIPAVVGFHSDGSRKNVARLAWLVCGLSVAFAVSGIVISYLNGNLASALREESVDAVTALQYAFRAIAGGDSQLVIVASTLAIAALAGPLRRRVQTLIDRRFYRSNYDAQKTLAAFSSRLRDETDLDALSDEPVAVERETVQPTRVALWLRPREDGTRKEWT